MRPQIVSGVVAVFRRNGKSLWLALIVAAVFVAVAATLLQSRNLIEEVVSTTENATFLRNEQLVVSAFKSVHSQLEKVAIDNGHWDDAVKHAYIVRDQEWLQANWGATTQQEGYVYDTSMLIDGMTGKAIAAFQHGKRVPFATEDLLGGHYGEFTKFLPADANTGGAATGFILTPDGLAVAALSAIVPYDTTLAVSTPRPNYLLFVKHLDHAFVADLAKQFLLDDLKIFADDIIAEKGKTLKMGASSLSPIATWASDDMGASIRLKLWRSAAPGHFILTLVLIGLAVACWSSLNRLHTSRDAALRDARHDALTGLGNRLALTEYIETASRHKRPEFSIAFCDLDGFKHVNDTHGHHIGDELLIFAAQSIASCCGPTDKVFRLGGDEFVVLFCGADSSEKAVGFAKDTSALLDQPIHLLGRAIDFGMSIGITSAAGREIDFLEVLRRADTAMYEAKKSTDSFWCRYEDIENLKELRSLALSNHRADYEASAKRA